MLKKLFWTAIVCAITFAPAMLFFWIKYTLNPQDFWQKLIVLGAGIWILGGLQCSLVLVGLSAIILIWNPRLRWPF